LSLRHARNRAMYHEGTDSVDDMNSILDKLVIYGYETSADIAKMQPWQLRILKKEIPRIDFIFMTAYRMWGKQEYYDDSQNLTFRQYWDPAVWLQYNEIELIIKCFDAPRRGYQCMLCGIRHGLSELDQVRWHIWLEHKDSTQLNAIMQASKKHHHQHHASLQHALPPLTATATRAISPNIREKSEPTQVISLLDDSTDDDMEVKQTRRRHTNKARPYNSKRTRRRSRRLANKNKKNENEDIQTPKTVQHPIIINGCNDNDDEYNAAVLKVHGSQSPAFMPSVNGNDNASNLRHQNMGQPNDSTFSLDTHDTHSMEMDDEYNWPNTNNHNVSKDIEHDLQMDEFNMIGFNDDFSTLGVMGVLSRNSTDSYNGELGLNSAFTDPSSFFSNTQKK